MAGRRVFLHEGSRFVDWVRGELLCEHAAAIQEWTASEIEDEARHLAHLAGSRISDFDGNDSNRVMRIYLGHKVSHGTQMLVQLTGYRLSFERHHTRKGLAMWEAKRLVRGTSHNSVAFVLSDRQREWLYSMCDESWHIRQL